MNQIAEKTTDQDQHIPRHRMLAKVVRPTPEDYDRALTADALMFLADLQRRFGPTRKQLLAARLDRQERYDCGERPTSPVETKHIRSGVWEVDPIPEILQDRRVEITGPVDRKMMINALNSGAKIFMADFEDASSPTFDNMVQGQINMQDFANGVLCYQDVERGKSYSLNEQTAVMIVRPRGWHLDEKNVHVDGEPMSAALFDFGLHIFHNGKSLMKDERGPFYYLPKIESYLEARLWNDVFNYAQAMCDIPQATIKATVLIETLPAAFEMDEILYELRSHIAGLNCGRWDYIFSYIKCLRNHKEFILPDRANVTMDKAFLRAYSLKLIETCHRRRAHAMGGMAAQIPVKDDDAANRLAFAKVRSDKEREVQQGHDGTWVAHPALVPVAMEVFDAHMPLPHQIHKKQQHPHVSEESLIRPHDGEITEKGIRTNIQVGIEYIAAWLNGRGAVPIHNLMEDAATAEISRTQIWQWLHHQASVRLNDGATTSLTPTLFEKIFQEEVNQLKEKLGDEAFLTQKFTLAADLFYQTATGSEFQDFLTLSAYEKLQELTNGEKK